MQKKKGHDVSKMDTDDDSESDDQYDLKGTMAKAREGVDKNEVNFIEGLANVDP